jgi:PAS domain-containing protein
LNANLNIKVSPPACSACGIAYIGAMIGGLIQQGRPLPIVLGALCRLFDAAAEGYASSVLLFDRSRTQIRHAIGPGLPAAYTRLLEGLPVTSDDRACDGTQHEKPESIIAQLMADILREDNGRALARTYGFKSCWWWPILSLTGVPLGVLAIYQREAGGYAPFPPALVQQLTDIASLAIERTRSDENVRRSEMLLAKAQRLSSTGSFSWCIATDELTWSDELYRIFEFDPDDSVSLEHVIARIHPEDLPSFHALVERARCGGGDLDCEHRLKALSNTCTWSLMARVIRTGSWNTSAPFRISPSDANLSRSSTSSAPNLRTWPGSRALGHSRRPSRTKSTSRF